MDLDIRSINIHGFNSIVKQNYIKKYAVENGVDILLVQETYIHNYVVSKQIEKFLNIEHCCVWSYSNHTSSCGVAIMIFNKNISINRFQTDYEGRLAYLDFSYRAFNNYRIVNIYAPTLPVDRNEFFKTLNPHLTCANNLILGGDFNFVIDTSLDKIGGNNARGTSGSKILTDMLHTYSLIDGYRYLYPNKKSVTWVNQQTTTVIGTRIDRFYISGHLKQSLTSFVVDPCPYSDHDFIAIKLDDQSGISYGKSYWKFNDTLLDDQHFINLFKYFWQIISETENYTFDWWEDMKSKIKLFCQDYSKSKNKRLYGELKALVHAYRSTLLKDASNIEKLRELKQKIKTLEDNLYRGSIVRSKANILESNENPTGYFFQLENKHAINKTITTINEKGTVYSTSLDILEAFRTFYQTLYNEEPVQKEINYTFLGDLPQVSNLDNVSLTGRITKEEISCALKLMQSGKSPGNDGITSSFYLTFFDIFGDILETIFNLSYTTGMLSPSQRSSYITLLCKDSSRADDMKCYRPISLLNTDYKILSKVVSLRLGKVLPSVIGIDQTCSVKGRSIFDNVHLLRNITDYVEQKDLSAAFICLDQEKAFDRVSWSYMYDTLYAFGFDESFISLIKLLYNDVSSSVIVNHHVSSVFPVRRGVRQGCSLSPLLYVLCIEPFVLKINNDEDIKGIKIPGKKGDIKISAYADDSTGVLTSDKSIHKYLYWAREFGRISGSKINYNKSKGMFLGKWKTRSDHPFGISWAENHKILGYKMGSNLSDDDIFSNLLKRFTDTLSLWKMRRLSLKGKSTILNSLCLSKILYYITARNVPNHYITLFQRSCFRHLWNSTSEPVARNTLYLPFLKGGLNIPNIALKCDSIYVHHVQKLLSEYDATWTYFAKYWIGLSLRQYNPNLASNTTPHSLTMPHFYSRCLSSFKRFASLTSPIHAATMCSTKFIYNTFLDGVCKQPKIERIHPNIDYISIWQNIFHTCISPESRDVMWRIAHEVLYVNYFLYIRHISEDKSCPLCGNIETITHLFLECRVVAPFNRLLLYLLRKISLNKIKFTESVFRFNILPQLECKVKYIALVLLSESKYVIWYSRNLKRHELKDTSSSVMASHFLNRLKLRILVDFARMHPDRFSFIWLNSDVFCKLVDNKIVFLPDIEVDSYFSN
ncbi:MAG: reverse transcriptase domain-containing protein [Sedimenticola sp.]